MCLTRNPLVNSTESSSSFTGTFMIESEHLSHTSCHGIRNGVNAYKNPRNPFLPLQQVYYIPIYRIFQGVLTQLRLRTGLFKADAAVDERSTSFPPQRGDSFEIDWVRFFQYSAAGADLGGVFKPVSCNFMIRCCSRRLLENDCLFQVFSSLPHHFLEESFCLPQPRVVQHARWTIACAF